MQAVVYQLLKKPPLDPGESNNDLLVSNVPFLRKVIEQVVAGQIQRFWNERFLNEFGQWK